MITAISIGDEYISPSYNEFKLFGYKEISYIYVGIVKTFPITKFNGRIYCVIQKDVLSNTQEFRAQMLADIYVPRKEVDYLFFLWLVQKENLRNFILGYKQKEIGSPRSYMEWKDLDVNQVEERVALIWEQTQRSLGSFNKFDEYPAASGWKKQIPKEKKKTLRRWLRQRPIKGGYGTRV
jgi:hypothetical protein